MISRSAALGYVTAVYVGLTFHVLAVSAADIEGAWTTDASACQKIFTKTGAGISFVSEAPLSGSGFIIEKSRIRGKLGSCNISHRRDQGPQINFIATCSSAVITDTLHFSLRIDGENKLIREFSGIPELQIVYERCSFNE